MSISPIVPARTFGAAAAMAAASAPAGETRPDAQLWLNVGYTSDPFVNPTNGETETRFVSLPYGIPLDTMSKIGAPTQRNPRGKTNLSELEVSQNDLLDDILAGCADLKPGETRKVVLEMEIRRVADKSPAVVSENSPLARKVPLFAAPAAATQASE